MTMIRTLMLAAAATAIPLGVAAENKPVQLSDIAPLHRMGMHVNAVIWPELTKIVPAEDALRLAIVAEQAAIAASCIGYDLDAELFGTVMNRLLAPVQALVAADKNNLPLDFVMNSYSTIKGGALARAGYDLEAFCAEADGFFDDLAAQAAETPDAALLVLKKAG